MINNNKKAFTLAEVLVTLVIIGIIAALVIPNVVAKYKRKVVEVQLMKSYNTLFNAFQKAEETCGIVSGIDSHVGLYFKRCVIPNLKATKLNFHEYKLDDGSVIAEVSASEAYPRGRYDLVRLGYLGMSVDINGTKGPNAIGKDVFYFKYFNKDAEIVPQDSQTSQALNQNNIRYLLVMEGEFNHGDNPLGITLKQNSLETIKNKCKDTSNKYNAEYCGAWIRLNGWKIPEDYPYL